MDSQQRGGQYTTSRILRLLQHFVCMDEKLKINILLQQSYLSK